MSVCVVLSVCRFTLTAADIAAAKTIGLVRAFCLRTGIKVHYYTMCYYSCLLVCVPLISFHSYLSLCVYVCMYAVAVA